MRKLNLKILALIPARSGSKSIPKKNIINFGGHPLLAYSIAVAKLSKFINRIIVTTDSKEFAEIAKSYGAETPFLRPKKFARDLSLDKEFFYHALDWLEKNERYIPDLVVHLRPTTPLREQKVVDKAILEVINDKKATALRSGNLSKETGYKIFKKRGDYIDFLGKEDFAQDEEYWNLPRQKLPPTYYANGYVDVIRPEILKKTGLLHGKRIRAFITEKKSTDLDSIEDLKSAEKILNNKKYIALINLLNKIKP